MTVRELLELAAKAAGLEYECTSHTGYPENDQHQVRDCFGMLVDWNPLTDDGDNARLEAVLVLNVIWGARAVRVGRELIVVNKDGPMVERYQDHGGDRQKARRWASVRAAAEIGKGMKNPS